MNYQGTYGLLIQIEIDIAKQENSSPAFKYLLFQKIEIFRQLNAVRLSIAKEKINQLMLEHIVHDAKGVPVQKDGRFVFKTEQDEVI